MKRYHQVFPAAFVLVFLGCAQACAQGAGDAPPSVFKEDKGPADYVYDLKLLIKKSKDNIRVVNEKIKEQAVIKRNQQREDKAREYYQQAMKLQEEGRLEEARQLFDKAIRITEHPEMKYYIKESARRSKLQATALEREQEDLQREQTGEQKALLERAAGSYDTAVTLYKQQKFREARDEFQSVEEMYPDYKAVRSYLQVVEQDIIQSEHLQAKEQKKEIERQQKEMEISRLREKELWRKEIEKKEEGRQEELRKQAQGIYDEALRLYGDHKYTEARDKFQELEWVVPDFKATRAYLGRVEADIHNEKKKISHQRQEEVEKQHWQDVLGEKKTADDRRKAMEAREQEKLAAVKDQAEFVYLAAVALFEKQLLAQSKEKFDEVEGIYPNYKVTRDYLKRIADFFHIQEERETLKQKAADERHIWEQELERRKAEKEKFKQLSMEADAAYNEAVRLYKTGRLIEAKEKFIEVDQRVPDYKSTRVYLKRVDEDIELMVKTQRHQEVLDAEREEVEKMRATRDKAEAVYNEGIAAYDAKDFVTARAKFEACEDIFPDFKKTKYFLARISEDARAAEETRTHQAMEREASGFYAQALTFYQAGQFEEAKKKFMAVEAVVTDFKQTSTYLDRIDDDILRKKEADLARMKEQRAQGVYDQAMALYRGGELAEAKEKFLEVEVVYPGYKETTHILETVDADIEKQKKEAALRQQTDAAEKLYVQAVELYRTGDYAAAKELFIKTEVVFPEYKDCLKYLSRIDADIARRRKEEFVRSQAAQADPLYAQALALYKESDFIEARNKFMELQGVIPGYKETELYLKRIEKDIRDQQERAVAAEKARKADGLYADAVKLYTSRQFEQAKARFIELTTVDPSYRNVRTYLSRIDSDIRDEAVRQAREHVEEQAAAPYAQAVTLYHESKFEEAKIKFREVFLIASDYKKTKAYLARLDGDIQAARQARDKERLSRAEALYKDGAVLMDGGRLIEAFMKFSDLEQVYPDYKAVRSNLVKLRRLAVEKDIELPDAPPSAALEAEDSAEHAMADLYQEGLQYYKDKKYDEAQAKFEAVGASKSDYRSTRIYLDRIKALKAAVPGAPAVAAAPAAVVPAVVSHELPQENDKALAVLATRSGKLYRQIKSLSEDKELSSTARTFAKVDRLIEDLQTERRRIAEDAFHQKKAEEQASVRKQRRDEEASRREAQKKARIASVQAAASKIRSTGRKASPAIDLHEEEQRQIRIKAEEIYQQGVRLWREKNYEASRERFEALTKLLPDYKDTGLYVARIERLKDDEALRREESVDRDAIQALAAKATAVNVEVLELSRKKQYAAVETRFNDLEAILKEIQAVKTRIETRRQRYESPWDKKPAAHQAGPAGAVFNEAEQAYAVQDYAHAREKFVEAVQIDPSCKKAAAAYIARIDRILARRDFESREAQKKIEDRVVALQGGAQTKNEIVIKRAVKVSNEGKSLYRIGRYREARIKFEELADIGSPAEKRTAQRYLELIMAALDKEKHMSEAQRRSAQERSFEQQHLKAQAGLEQDKRSQARELDKTKAITADQRLLDIRREQGLKAIEDQNALQRGSAGRRSIADEKKKIALEKAVAQKKARDESSALTRKLEEARARDRKDREEQDMLRRNRAAVQSILKGSELADARGVVMTPAPAAVELPSAGIPPEDPSTLLLKQTAAREKRRLEEQRTAIRKEFEEGVERFYNEAVDLYKKKNYEEALEGFAQVDGLIKGYKKTDQYLEDSRRALGRGRPVQVPQRPLLPAGQDRMRSVTSTLDAFDQRTSPIAVH